MAVLPQKWDEIVDLFRNKLFLLEIKNKKKAAANMGEN